MNNFEYKENDKQFKVKVDMRSKANNLYELSKNKDDRYDNLLVVKTITLDLKDFQYFCRNLLDDFNFIKENENHHKVKAINEENKSLDTALLITTLNNDFGIIVETQGYSYARYSGYYHIEKTPHERLIELDWVLVSTVGEVYTYKLKGSGNLYHETIEIAFKGERYYTTLRFIDLELAEILVDYLKELSNE